MKNETDILERLKLLEARVSALDGLAAPSPKSAATALEGVVTVSHVVERSNFEMPNETQLRKLMEIVHRKYPAPTFRGKFAVQDERDYFRGVMSAFEYLGRIGRADVPDKNRYAAYWHEQAEDWFHNQGRQCAGDVGVGFFVALLSHGDIDFIAPDRFQGVISAYALKTFGGRPCSNAWRNVLSTGKLRQPTSSGASRSFYPTPEPSVRYGS